MKEREREIGLKSREKEDKQVTEGVQTLVHVLKTTQRRIDLLVAQHDRIMIIFVQYMFMYITKMTGIGANLTSLVCSAFCSPFCAILPRKVRSILPGPAPRTMCGIAQIVFIICTG